MLFGVGKKFRAAMPGAYNRFLGMRPRTPPSLKHPPVLVALHGRLEFGSLMVLKSAVLLFPSALFLSTLCEKSPARSRRVGKVASCRPCGFNCFWYSWLKKKKSLFLVFSLGMITGPPM